MSDGIDIGGVRELTHWDRLRSKGQSTPFGATPRGRLIDDASCIVSTHLKTSPVTARSGTLLSVLEWVRVTGGRNGGTCQ